MIDILTLICINLTVLYIWFKTNAFVDYCNLLNISKPIKKFLKQTDILSYPQYLFINKDSIGKSNKFIIFLIKLITCPVCLLFWTTLVLCLSTFNLELFFVIYITSLFCYLLLSKLSV